MARYAGAELFDHQLLAPVPVPPAFAPTIALLFGVAIALVRPTLVRSWLWLAMGVLAALVFYTSAGFGDLDSGGLQSQRRRAVLSGSVLVSFAVALLPALYAEVARLPLLGRAVGAMMGVVFSSFLVSVYVVAYKFCPGGFLLREAHYVLLVLGVGGIACQYVSGWHCKASTVQPMMPRTGSLKDHRKDGSGSRPARPRREPLMLFALLVLLFVPSISQRWTPSPVRQANASVGTSEDIKMGIWTIHFGYNNVSRCIFFYWKIFR